MSPTRFAFLILIPLSAARAAATPPAGTGTALLSGDTVEFDLSKLPDALEGEAVAVCIGMRNSATGPVEARCERPFRFELPADDARMVSTFRASNGRETRVELPVLRSTRPTTFVAPADGSLLPLGPIPFPPEATDAAARRSAGGQCGACQGSGFTLESVKVTRSPVPAPDSLPVRFKVTRKGAPSPK